MWELEPVYYWGNLFKFSHTFIICDRLLETYFLFGVDLQKRYSLSFYQNSDKHLFIQREDSFLTYTRNSGDLHNIAVVKSTLKIPPRQKGAIPIRIKGHNIKDQVTYFISNQHTKKGLEPNIHVIDSIYNIKGKSTLCIIVANYTNKHVSLNKGQYIDHIELWINNMAQTFVNSVITLKMMDDQVQLDTFTPLLQNLSR